jgi:hypothetical protein
MLDTEFLDPMKYCTYLSLPFAASDSGEDGVAFVDGVSSLIFDLT